jgi:aminopeptidase YwaD
LLALEFLIKNYNPRPYICSANIFGKPIMTIKNSLLLLLLCTSVLAFSKGNTNDKVDNSPKGKILQDIQYLCMEALQGRLTGSEGEKLAADYIQTRFEVLGLPGYKGRYKWDFTMQTGTVLGKNAYVKINDSKLTIGNDILFMPYSFGNEFSGACMPGVDEADNVWLVPLSKLQLQKSNTPQKLLYEHAKSLVELGPKAIVYFNDINTSADITLGNSSKYEGLNLPVAVISYNAYQQYVKPNRKKDWIFIEAKLGYEESSATGKNVLGFIDNKAPLTMVIAANYDHIGNENGHYVGADNNASGVAGLFYLAELIKTTPLPGYNYLFIAFSGKEQNTQGSSGFLKQNENWLNSFSCMINLDMIGRYKSSTKEVYVTGVGTSPMWKDILPKVNLGYNFRIDSSGYGYSDMTSFYLKNIPALRFSTGYHDDFLTENDVPEKINAAGEVEVLNVVYKTLAELSKSTKPSFTKTPEALPKLKNLRVDMGIMPDFSFNEEGIKIGACIKNKIASKAGFQSGDVIIKIGEYDISDVDDYVKAIKKSSEERETAIVIKRGKEEYKFFVLLN